MLTAFVAGKFRINPRLFLNYDYNDLNSTLIPVPSA
jgi:hypothetical protein